MDFHISCNVKLFTLLYLALQCFLWKSSLTVSVQQGQNVTLSCPLIPNSSYGVLSWYKQTSWHGPRLILSYNITNTSLLITDFYSSTVSGEKGQINQMFSRGLRLIVEVPHVRVDHLLTPKVHVLLPAGVEMQRSKRVTLACVITGLQSKEVRITWRVNGATVLKKHASSAQVHQEPGAFM
ncbi:immunoglobulin lambda light chain [Labeo rohita]|nr:immunoglobulin lambda light chain [Labeo rohita]